MRSRPWLALVALALVFLVGCDHATKLGAVDGLGGLHGRDKRNPKPLDAGAFATLVKTASEVLRRHEQAARAALHRSLTFTTDAGVRVRAELDVAVDDDDPHAILAVVDLATDAELRRGRVSQGFKLTATTVQGFVRSGHG